jgi:hypothetical protein
VHAHGGSGLAKGRTTSRRALSAWAAAVVLAGPLAVLPGAVGTAEAATPAVTPTTVYTCTAQSPSSLVNGSYMQAGGCLLSPDQRYELIMQPDGNLVLYYQTSANPLWASQTSGNADYMTLQTTGNLIVNGSSLFWQSGSAAPNTSLVLQNDGNLVIYSVTGAVWSTGTDGNRTTVSTCNAQSPSTVTAPSTLASGGCVVSPDQKYALEMQTDGNLVLYFQPFSGRASPLWDSNTADNPGAVAQQQLDGNFVVYSTAGVALWNSGTGGTPNSILTMQADGNAVVYGNSFSPQTTSGSRYAAWSSQTENLRGDQLTSGQVLEPGQYLKSPNGQFGLTMGQGGVLVLYNTGLGTGGYQCPIWSTPGVTGVTTSSVTYSSTPNPGAYLQMTTTGNLALWAPGGAYSSWASGTSQSGDYASLQSDGNLVIYNSAGTALWSTNSATNDPDHGWALCSGSTLQENQSIYSVSGGYHLEMQSDCNLVLYSSTGTATWASNTDVNQSQDFTKSKDDSTLYDMTPPPAENYSGCYAQMTASGYLVIIAPNTTGYGYEGPHQIWSYQVNQLAPTIQMPLGSFGPYLAYPNSSGQLKIDNGAGVGLATNPTIDVSTKSDLKNSGTGADLGEDIGKFMLQVFFTFLFL